jgi:hypothetical protein
MKKKTTRMTITCSIDAYRKVGELAPTQKPTESIRQILESLIYFKGNYYELLGMIGTKNKDKNW